MSLHSDIILTPSQPVFDLYSFNAEYFPAKHNIPNLSYSVWPVGRSNPWSNTPRGEHVNYYNTEIITELKVLFA